MLRSVASKFRNRLQDRLAGFRGRGTGGLSDCSDQSGFTEFLELLVERLRHSVGVNYQDVIRMELDCLLLVTRVGEQTNHRPAGRQEHDVAGVEVTESRANQDGR